MPSKYFVIEPTALGWVDLPQDQFGEGVQESAIEDLTDYVKECVEAGEMNIRRGDVIGLEPIDVKYRNDWTYVWDGEKVLELDSSIDEYGAVPKSLVVTDTEFTPTWWSGTIAHNGIFWLSEDIKKRMVFKRGEVQGTQQIYADFTIGETPWRCYVDYIDWVGDDDLAGLAEHQGVYFETCESECTVRDRENVMYLHRNLRY